MSILRDWYYISLLLCRVQCFETGQTFKSSEPHTSHLLAQLVAQLANYWHVIHVLDSTGHSATFDSLWHILTHVDTHIESACCCRRSCVYSFTTLSQSQGAFQIEAVVAFLRQSLVVSCHSLQVFTQDDIVLFKRFFKDILYSTPVKRFPIWKVSYNLLWFQFPVL